MAAKAPPQLPNASTLAVDFRTIAAAEPPKASLKPHVRQAVTSRFPNQTPKAPSKPSKELTQMPQAPAETPHRPPKSHKTTEIISTTTEPPQKAPKGSSKPSATQPTRPPIIPPIPQSELLSNLKGHHADTQIAQIDPKDHPWNVVYKDDETGEGPIVQHGHTVMMWYFCRMKETGTVFQQSTTADGPPVEFLPLFVVFSADYHYTRRV